MSALLRFESHCGEQLFEVLAACDRTTSCHRVDARIDHRPPQALQARRIHIGDLNSIARPIVRRTRAERCGEAPLANQVGRRVG